MLVSNMRRGALKKVVILSKEIFDLPLQERIADANHELLRCGAEFIEHLEESLEVTGTLRFGGRRKDYIPCTFVLANGDAIGIEVNVLWEA